MGSFARVTVHTTRWPRPRPVRGARARCELAGYDVHTLKPARDAVIVIGSEGRGSLRDVQALVTKRVTIPATLRELPQRRHRRRPLCATTCGGFRVKPVAYTT